MAVKEAGERRHDLNGGDLDVSEKAAGHSMEEKTKYYKKVSYEEHGGQNERLFWMKGDRPSVYAKKSSSITASTTICLTP